MPEPPAFSGEEQIVGLGLRCELGSLRPEAMSRSFDVQEFAELDDGRRIILTVRGFTEGLGGANLAHRRLAAEMTEASVTESALMSVLPDDVDSPEDHPWDELAAQLRELGLAVEADRLRRLPYQVEFSAELRSWLRTG